MAVREKGDFSASEQVKVLYSIFLGLLLATAIGLGVAAFYPSPDPPVYREAFDMPEGKMNAEEERRARDEQERYSASTETYNRNVSVIAVPFAIMLFGASMALLRRIPVIANGLMLGGLFTLIYAIIRSFGSGDQKFMFVIVLIGIAFTLAVGYLRLIRPEPTG